MLARFLLFGDDVTRKISTLSGGQRARLSLCLLLHGETNLLILDEPTNYVDIRSKHILEQALAEYDGVVITVTHDRYFLDNVCNKVAEVAKGTVKVYNGNYTDLKGKPVARKAPSKAANDSVERLEFTNIMHCPPPSTVCLTISQMSSFPVGTSKDLPFSNVTSQL